VKQDIDEAARWFRKAAEQGFVEATQALNQMNEAGVISAHTSVPQASTI